MATLFRRKSGTWSIQFSLKGKRKTVSIGKASRDMRRKLLDNMETLVECRNCAIDPPTRLMEWFDDLGPRLRKSILKAGLMPVNQLDCFEPRTITDLVAYHVAMGKSEWKPVTLEAQAYATDTLTEFFQGRSLESITPGCADEYRVWMVETKGLAKTTANRRCSIAKMVFSKAVDKRWIESNPFGKLKRLSTKNSERLFIVDNATSLKIVKNFHLVTKNRKLSAELAAIFAMYRWGGLRADEIRHVRWEWIDFKNRQMQIYAPKTNSTRQLPLFPEVAEYLGYLWKFSPKHSEFVFPKFCASSTGWFSGRLKALLKKLEIDRWGRLLQNLRATRSTEIMRKYGPKYESSWIGHSTKISMESYQMLEQPIIDSAAQWVTDTQ